VKDKDFALLNAEQHTRGSIGWKIASHFPQPVTQGTTKGHSDRPSILDSHEVLSNRVPISLVQRAQPISDHLGAGRRAIENDRDLARPLSVHP